MPFITPTITPEEQAECMLLTEAARLNPFSPGSVRWKQEQARLLAGGEPRLTQRLVLPAELLS
jgi:hypothetical protein